MLACVLGLAGWLAGLPAQADDALPVQVDVTTVSTRTLTLGQPGEIEITGTITNTSPRPMTWVTVELWRSATPLTTPQQLTAAVSSGPLSPTGARLRNASTGNMVTITQADEFAPGRTASFTIKATAAELGFVAEGAYPIGVHVRALTADGLVATVGVNRWLLPVASSNHPHATLVALTAKPTMTTKGAFINNQLVGEIGGRLNALLRLAERPGASFAIDPALYDEVSALADDHVMSGSAQPALPAARSWLARLNTLIANGTGYRLPYGNPNLSAALARDALTATQAQLAIAVPADHPTAALRPAFIGGNEALVSRLDPRSTALTPDLTGNDGRLVGTTPFPARALAPNADAAFPLRQQQLAEELVGSLSGRPVVRVLSTAADIEAEQLSVGWRTLTSLSSLPTSTPTWTPSQPDTPDAALTRELAAWTTDIELYRDLTENAATVTNMARASLKSQSSALTPGEAIDYLHQAATLLPPAEIAQFRSQPSFVMAGSENQFPVSITNHAPAPIRVRVMFTSSNPQRVEVADSELVTIPAGETVSVNVTVTASSTSVVGVSAWLESASGRRIGQAHDIEITSTNAGRVGWVIIIASGMLVVGGTVWRIRAVQRGGRKGA